MLVLPIFFKKEVKATITNEVSKHIAADFSIDAISVHVFTSFPKVSIVLSDILISNKTPFAGDTLVYIENVELKTSLDNLLSKKLSIDYFSASNADIRLKTNIDNISNYDIFKKTERNTVKQKAEDTSTNSALSLHIEKYTFNNIQLNYLDEKSLLSVQIKNLNHSGNGLFSEQDVLLSTYTSIQAFTLSSKNINYLKNAALIWNADINLNLSDLKVEFKKNLAKINDLNMSFHGFLQPIDNGIKMKLDFDSKGSKFKSLLSLIPSAYSANFKDVIAKGLLNFNGKAIGTYTDTSIPKFDIKLNTSNASCQYPELPKAISNIYMDTTIGNSTGNIDDTSISIHKFEFKIDEDYFSATSHLTNLSNNPKFDAKLKGVVNLKKLSQAYPLEIKEQLEGTVRFDLQSKFTQNDIENKRYTNIKNSGSISLKKMRIKTALTPNIISIQEASLKFTPKNFILKKFIATTAESDLNAKGTITNLIEFVAGNKSLKGEFLVKSNNINVFNFLSNSNTDVKPSQASQTTNSQINGFQIPKKIDITTKIIAKRVSYDAIDFTNMTGVLQITNQKAVFTNTKANLLGGNIMFDGNVDTQTTPSNFRFALSLKALNIKESFETIDLFSSIAPIGKAFDGKMSMKLNLNGDLDKDLFPETKSLIGSGITSLQVKNIDSKKSKSLAELEKKFSFIDFDKLNMKKVETKLNFKNGTVYFDPFKIATYDGIPIEMEGSHSFENNMNYTLGTKIPAKHLGKEAANLLNGLNPNEIENIQVPIKININGSIDNPNIDPDYSAALKVITKKVLESQKNKLLDNLLGKNKKNGDNTQGSNEIQKAKKLLKGLFK